MRNVITIATVLALLAGAQAQPGPGPGEPFGGDDTGCIPPTSQLLTCSQNVVQAFRRLESAVTRCHTLQANVRYRQVVLGSAETFDEQACESRAAARFDGSVGRLAKRACLASPLRAGAADDRVALVAALDAQNGGPYCDAASATAIDPGGNNAGFVPGTAPIRYCAQKVTQFLSTLAAALRSCHRTAASMAFHLANPPFDDDLCEAKARARFDTSAARLRGRGGCPPCLDATTQGQLADAVVARLDAANGAAFPCPDPVLHPGALQLDRPTLIALGVQWRISGDTNYNAAVTLRYRQLGAPAWKDALPLFRVRPETVPDHVVPEQFAGSIFDLRPATTYEIEVHATDPDGNVDETRTLTATTRAVPGDPASPHVVAVTTAAELQAALANAQAGDVISLADGVYTGQFVLDASGTVDNPIVIRGASRDGTILDGAGAARQRLRGLRQLHARRAADPAQRQPGAALSDGGGPGQRGAPGAHPRHAPRLCARARTSSISTSATTSCTAS